MDRLDAYLSQSDSDARPDWFEDVPDAPAPSVVLTDAELSELVKAAHTVPYGIWMDKDYDIWAFRAESLRAKLVELGIVLTRETRDAS